MPAVPDSNGRPADLAPTLMPVAAREGGARAGLDAVRRSGWRAVQLDARTPGLRPRELDGTGRRDLRAVLRRLELAPSGMDFLIPHEHLVDPARADRAVAATVDAAELAADLGGLVLSVHLPEQLGGGDASGGAGASPDTGASADAEVIAHVIARAERFGVRLADHGPTPPAGAGIGVDPVACFARGEDPVAAILRAGDRLEAVRACDLLPTGIRGPLGIVGGRLDVAALRAALSVAGWDRPVVADVRHIEDVFEALDRTAAAWQAALPADFL